VKQVWRFAYGALLLVSVFGGAGVFGREDYSRTNIDWYFVAASFAGGLIFPSLAMWKARTSHLTPVPSPSFSRGLRGSWWSDPLQWLRICNISLSGAFAGVLIGATEASGQGTTAIYWKGSMALGFLLGSFLARMGFRKDIAEQQ